MAKLRIPKVLWPGIQQVVSYTGTLSHGEMPSVHRLDIVPQKKMPAAIGTLTLDDGVTRIDFKDCLIDSATLGRNAAGMVVTVNILDRRWKWKFGGISGQYNVVTENGDLIQPNKGGKDAIDDPERTPQQLAKLCLDQMGEVNADVGDLPKDVRPVVEWDLDTPAHALEELCSDLGCRLVLQLDGRVAIRKTGFGPGGKLTLLPTKDLAPDTMEGIDTPEMPDSLFFASAPNRYQVDLLLEAVGLDTDGQFKPINDLSYKPAQGWSVFDREFSAVAKASRAVALRTVYRYYRVKTPFKIPGVATFDRRESIAILGDQVQTVVEDDVRKALPAVVFGTWYTYTAETKNSTTSLTPLADRVVNGESIIEGWRLDEKRHMVIFNDPVVRTVGDKPNQTWAGAYLVLRTAVNIRGSETRSWLRHSVERKLRQGPGLGTGPRVILREDVKPAQYSIYEAGGYMGGGTDGSKCNAKHFSNKKEVEAAAKHYLDAAEAEYKVNDQQTAHYNGWQRIELDGGIQSITWSFSERGAFTTVERNRDYGSPTTISWRERKRIMKAAAEEKKKQESTPAVQRTKQKRNLVP